MDGTVVQVLDTDIPGATGIRSIRIDANNNILMGGRFNIVQSFTHPDVQRIPQNADGSINPGDSWASDCGGAGSSTVYGVTLDSAGSIFVCGDFATFEGKSRAGVARLLP